MKNSVLGVIRSGRLIEGSSGRKSLVLKIELGSELIDRLCQHPPFSGNDLVKNLKGSESNVYAITHNAHTPAREAILKSNQQNIGFQLFWKAYPRKVGKSSAWISWKKVFKSLPPIDRLKRILATQTEYHGWDHEDKEKIKFIPHPSTWLNQGRWEDELEIRRTVRKPMVDMTSQASKW